MTITFYLGKDYRDIHAKFQKVKKYYAKNLNKRYSNSDCFRFIVNLLYKEIIKAEKLRGSNK
jgi:hypothetical protein